MPYNPRDFTETAHGLSNKGSATLNRIFEALGDGDYDPDAILAEWKEAELQDAIGYEQHSVTRASKAIDKLESGTRNPYLNDDEDLANLGKNLTPEALSEIELTDPDFSERVVNALVYAERAEKAAHRRAASALNTADEATAGAEAAHEKVVESFRNKYWTLPRQEREEMAQRLGIKDVDNWAPDHAFGQDGETGGEGE